MAVFRLLRPHFIGAVVYDAGTIVSDERNGELPPNWLPPYPDEVEAMDGDALYRVIEAERKLRGRRGGER
jgi:hypothetical protein